MKYLKHGNNYFSCIEISRDYYGNKQLKVSSYAADVAPSYKFKDSIYFTLPGWISYRTGDPDPNVYSEEISKEDYETSVSELAIKLWKDYDIQDRTSKNSYGAKPSLHAISAMKSFCEIHNINEPKFMQKVYVDHIVNKLPLNLEENKIPEIPITKKTFIRKITEFLGF